MKATEKKETIDTLVAARDALYRLHFKGEAHVNEGYMLASEIDSIIARIDRSRSWEPSEMADEPARSILQERWSCAGEQLPKG